MSSFTDQLPNRREHSLTGPKKIEGNGKESQYGKEGTVWLSELTSKTTPRLRTNERSRADAQKSQPVSRKRRPGKVQRIRSRRRSKCPSAFTLLSRAFTLDRLNPRGRAREVEGLVMTSARRAWFQTWLRRQSCDWRKPKQQKSSIPGSPYFLPLQRLT